jgi:hypothetical protein
VENWYEGVVAAVAGAVVDVAPAVAALTTPTIARPMAAIRHTAFPRRLVATPIAGTRAPWL